MENEWFEVIDGDMARKLFLFVDELLLLVFKLKLSPLFESLNVRYRLNVLLLLLLLFMLTFSESLFWLLLFEFKANELNKYGEFLSDVFSNENVSLLSSSLFFRLKKDNYTKLLFGYFLKYN